MAILIVAAAVVLVGGGVVAYCREARLATGRPDARSLVAAQVGLLFVAVVPFAFPALGWFLTGRLLEAAAAIVVPTIVGGALAGLGTQIAWWRHGRPSAAQKQAAVRRWGAQLLTNSARVAWLELGFMSLLTATATGQAWLFYVRDVSADMVTALALVPPVCAMGLAVTVILAARVPGRQPFRASVLAAGGLGVASLATGFFIALHLPTGFFIVSQVPRQSVLFGLTAMCALLTCLNVLIGIYFRSMVLRAVAAESVATPEADGS